MGLSLIQGERGGVDVPEEIWFVDGCFLRESNVIAERIKYPFIYLSLTLQFRSKIRVAFSFNTRLVRNRNW